MHTSAARTCYLLVSMTAESLLCVPASAQGVVPGRPGTTSRNDFPIQAEAIRHCVGRRLVWVVAAEHAYYVKGAPGYGTKQGGAYMCEDEAKGDGNRPAGAGQRAH
jgi:hypothetical protein